MILHELNKLYERFVADPAYDAILPRIGYSIQNISFVVVLSLDGRLFDIQDARNTIEIPSKGKSGMPKTKFVPKNILVPGMAHPSGTKPSPRLLWDSTDYMLGWSATPTRSKRAIQLFAAYQDYHRSYVQEHDIQDPAFHAVIAFLDSWKPEAISEDLRAKLKEYGKNFGLFQIQGETRYVHQADEIAHKWEEPKDKKGGTGINGMCLITGKQNIALARLVEPKIKIGTSVGGSVITSFNDSAYESYGKEQAYNSPISKQAAFQSANALNALLNSDRHRFRLGNTTVLYWTEKKTVAEDLLAWILEGKTPEQIETQDTALLQKLKAFWNIMGTAGDPMLAGIGDDPATRFYMMGITPCAARIAIRFWHEGTLGHFVERLKQHHVDMRIRKPFDSDPEFIPIWQILLQTARDADGIPPRLEGSIMRAILGGTHYPQSLYQLVLNRINAEHKDYKVGRKVSYIQAAIIQAYLKRRNEYKGDSVKDTKDKYEECAKRLGRLFATLEKTQYDASGNVNAGVGDKFYSSASSTPRIVFPTLLDLFKKHLKKLSADKPGMAISRDKLVREILYPLEEFPATLTLAERGFFALGYYHQMQDLFTAKDKPATETK